jgi:hypothetical protein
LLIRYPLHATTSVLAAPSAEAETTFQYGQEAKAVGKSKLCEAPTVKLTAAPALS